MNYEAVLFYKQQKAEETGASGSDKPTAGSEAGSSTAAVEETAREKGENVSS